MYLILYTTVAYLGSSPQNGGDDLYYPAKSNDIKEHWDSVSPT